jgi:hypothetical protein
MSEFLTIYPGWTIREYKGGFALYYCGQRCKDPLKQTGLGGRFDSCGRALLALRNCTFDVYEGLYG